MPGETPRDAHARFPTFCHPVVEYVASWGLARYRARSMYRRTSALRIASSAPKPACATGELLLETRQIFSRFTAPMNPGRRWRGPTPTATACVTSRCASRRGRRLPRDHHARRACGEAPHTLQAPRGRRAGVRHLGDTVIPYRPHRLHPASLRRYRRVTDMRREAQLGWRQSITS